jgi:hypothetical protein
MIIRYSRYANARLQALPEPQQAQAKRLIRAILLADTTVGRPWNQDLRGRLQWIVSAADTHVVYRIAFRQTENTLYVTNVLVFPTPPDPNNP